MIKQQHNQKLEQERKKFPLKAMKINVSHIKSI